jgi:hypothetical protein
VIIHGEFNMKDYAILLLIIGLAVLIWKLFTKPECNHAEQVFYDAAGDELPGDQSEACFCTCLKCGREAVIPSGFQSDAHFDNYLHLREQGGSRSIKKNKGK